MTIELINVCAWGLVVIAAVLVALSPTGDLPSAVVLFTGFSGGGGVLAAAAPFAWSFKPNDATAAIGFALAGILLSLIPYVRSRRQHRRAEERAPSRPGRYGG